MSKSLQSLNIEDINWEAITDPSTKLKKQSKVFWDKQVKEFNEDMKKERSEININLSLAKDMARPWHDNPGLFHIDKYEKLIQQAVADQWGNSAKVDFNRVSNEIKATHESGLFLLI